MEWTNPNDDVPADQREALNTINDVLYVYGGALF